MTGFLKPAATDFMRHSLVPAFCAGVTAAALMTSCSRPSAPAPPPPKVTVALPQSRTITNWDEYPGHLEAVEMVDVRPRVTGYLDSIHFADGAEVFTAKCELFTV